LGLAFYMTNRSGKNGIVAVMDLGTNTFHLLIAQGSATEPEELYHATVPVRLGEGGINNGIIQTDAYNRGLNTMQIFSEKIKEHGALTIKAIATSALRGASNGQRFIDEVKTKTEILIEIIDGDREAEYIYEGVKAGGCLSKQTSLILDIGGGSVEFIIGNEDGIAWKQSFEIGAARMLDKFHYIDPISEVLISEMNAYLEQALIPFFEVASNIQIDNIIGSSGSFETFAALVELQKGKPFELKNNPQYKFDLKEFIQITDWLIQSSHQERTNIKGIIPVRVDMIVSASIITRLVMKKLQIDYVVMTINSLKEGVLAEALVKV